MTTKRIFASHANLLLFRVVSVAQVKGGNNSDTINTNCVLEAEATNRGLSLPLLSACHSAMTLQNDYFFSSKQVVLALFLTLFFISGYSSVYAQCNPTCTLDNIGMYQWMGDNDGQSIGDATNDDEDGDDFIVYRNYGTTAVDISGWQLYTDIAGSTTPVFTFPSGTVLQPGETATIVADWNPGPALPTRWFDANYNVGGEGLFEETSNNESYAILRNPTTNQYITTHQQGASSAGQSLASGTKVCNTNVTSLIPNDFEGCEVVYWDFSTCSYREVTNCVIPTLFNCIAGSSAPVLSTTAQSNNCPATTANLTSVTASNTPAGTTLTWHSGTPATTANKIGDVTSLSANTYHAAFFDAGNNCYSTATRALVVSITTCGGAGTIDCNKTVISSAIVPGVAGQHDLVVTVNVTTVSPLALTVTGSGITLANGITSVTPTGTGTRQLHIPINYNGSALGTLNFTVGSTGSCSANLANLPTSQIIQSQTRLNDCTAITPGTLSK